MKDPIKDISSQFLNTIPQAMWMIRTEVRKVAKKTLTTPQYRVLASLSHTALTNKQLAEHQGVHVASMSKMVDGLVKKNWVKRLENPLDRREVSLVLTQKGFQIFTKIRNQAKEGFQKYFKNIPENEILEIFASLEKLEKYLLEWKRQK